AAPTAELPDSTRGTRRAPSPPRASTPYGSCCPAAAPPRARRARDAAAAAVPRGRRGRRSRPLPGQRVDQRANRPRRVSLEPVVDEDQRLDPPPQRLGDQPQQILPQLGLGIANPI